MTRVNLVMPNPLPPHDNVPPTGPVPGRKRVATIKGDGIKVSLPFAPREATITPATRRRVTVDRPGRDQLLLDGGRGTRTLTWNPLISHRDVEVPVEGLLTRLQRLAEKGPRVRISGMSALEAGPWLLTDVSWKVVARQAGTNAVTRVEASLVFTEPSKVDPKLGPLTGGHQGTGHGGGKTRHYTVQKGDTLRSIANHFYGDPNEWKRIAKANDIKDPTKIHVGQRLEIPPDPKKDDK